VKIKAKSKVKIKAKSKVKIKAKSKVKRRRKRNQRKIHQKILLLKNLIRIDESGSDDRKEDKKKKEDEDPIKSRKFTILGLKTDGRKTYPSYYKKRKPYVLLCGTYAAWSAC
jgi:hypothetical protein